MDKQICSQCKHYKQHYALDGRTIFRVYFGHCTLSGAKAKRPDAAACACFESGETDENAFVSKEYLSKALLKYVLELELLPEIKDVPRKSQGKI